MPSSRVRTAADRGRGTKPHQSDGGRHAPLSADPQTGLSADQEQVVIRNMPLVHHIVARMTERIPSSYSRDDLIQAGALGLIEAARRFDPELGFSFSTFAGRRIEGAVLDALRRADWASRSVRRRERQLRTADLELQATLGRQATDQELSASMKVDIQQLRDLRADLARARLDSLDRPAVDGADESTKTEVASPQEEQHLLEQREMMGYLRDAISLLPERHRFVITGHFLEGMTMTDLGQSLGVTQSRASQMKNEALSMMKRGLQTAVDDDHPATESGRKQNEYNDALRAASTWRERLGPVRSGNDLTAL